MKCSFCGDIDSKVIDSRPTDDFARIRRRRECLKCTKRFTTYEIVEKVALVVVKKDKSREEFDREKLLVGLLRASYKRPVSYQRLENVVDNLEQTLQSGYEKEISSYYIGELAMQELKKVDQVAYVRFASVYREFNDIDSFKEELEKLTDKENE